MIYDQVIERYNSQNKQLAFLIDPDKFSWEMLPKLQSIVEKAKPDLLFVGGSLVSVEIGAFVKKLKQYISLPVILYPGSSSQMCDEVDAVLFISLISGRNPEFLISHHVAVAPQIKAKGIEAISTGYILVDGGSQTSVQYMSQTQPIPADKKDIAVATALAGQYLGMKLIYLDAGSGAKNPISKEMITAVSNAIDVPLLVGGGLKTTNDVKAACESGADIVVVGNIFEKDLSLINDFCDIVHQFNK